MASTVPETITCTVSSISSFAAKLENPIRWSSDIKNWDHIEEVYLNPEKGKSEIKERKAA